MKKKIMAAALAVCMMATLVAGMTLAYFTDTDSKTNTFTVGNVDITLTEPSWLGDTSEDAVRLIPGKTIAKDPTITVAQGSQTAYTFMKVELSDDFVTLIKTWATEQKIDLTSEAGLKQVIAAWFAKPEGYNGPAIMEYGKFTGGDENYVILGVLSPKDPGQSVEYFSAVTVPGTVTQNMIKANGTYTINITAYAIQAEGFVGENADAQADRLAAFTALFPDETPLA